MTYVPPVYPTTIPTVGDLPDRVDDVDWLYAARYNELKKELRAALTELGTTPKGASANVAARLATLQISLGNGITNPTNIIYNGKFILWTNGIAVAPDGWTLVGAGASVARELTTPTPKLGTDCAALTRSGTDCTIQQSGPERPSYYQNRTYTFGCWAWASVANRACLSVNDGITESFSSYHTGNSTWQWLSYTMTMAPAATHIIARCYLANGDTTVCFVGAILVEGSIPYAFSTKPLPTVNPTAVGVMTSPKFAGSLNGSVGATTPAAGSFTDIIATGDIYNVQWADYGGSSTIIGWSTLETKKIMYKKIGSLVFVAFYIDGSVSNSSVVTFTLPYTSNGNTYLRGTLGEAKNNGAFIASASKWYLNINSNIVSCFVDMAGSGWTASGGKMVLGQFFFETNE